jgi:hypothetical protein
MTKYLSAKEKAEELGITTSGLAKTRHLYKHIRKSPHKYLYFEEDPREVVRPNMVNGPVTPVNSSTPRSHRRHGVPFGEENYHKAPGGSGDKLKVLNQMRAKAALEGKIAPGDLKYLDGAMAIKIKDNARQIVEQEQNRKRSEILAEEQRIRKNDPSRYGGLIRGNRTRLVDVSTPWKNLFETPKTEYDVALEELGENSSEKKYYW